MKLEERSPEITSPDFYPTPQRARCEGHERQAAGEGFWPELLGRLTWRMVMPFYWKARRLSAGSRDAEITPHVAALVGQCQTRTHRVAR
jgi:hypothetical protein